MSNLELYILAVVISAAISAALTPLVRWVALQRGWVDRPSGPIKTHKIETPAMGGCAIGVAYAVAANPSSTGYVRLNGAFIS